MEGPREILSPSVLKQYLLKPFARLLPEISDIVWLMVSTFGTTRVIAVTVVEGITAYSLPLGAIHPGHESTKGDNISAENPVKEEPKKDKTMQKSKELLMTHLLRDLSMIN